MPPESVRCVGLCGAVRLVLHQMQRTGACCVQLAFKTSSVQSNAVVCAAHSRLSAHARRCDQLDRMQHGTHGTGRVLVSVSCASFDFVGICNALRSCALRPPHVSQAHSSRSPARHSIGHRVALCKRTDETDRVARSYRSTVSELTGECG